MIEDTRQSAFIGNLAGFALFGFAWPALCLGLKFFQLVSYLILGSVLVVVTAVDWVRLRVRRIEPGDRS